MKEKDLIPILDGGKYGFRDDFGDIIKELTIL